MTDAPSTDRLMEAYAEWVEDDKLPGDTRKQREFRDARREEKRVKLELAGRQYAASLYIHLKDTA